MITNLDNFRCISATCRRRVPCDIDHGGIPGLLTLCTETAQQSTLPAYCKTDVKDMGTS